MELEVTATTVFPGKKFQLQEHDSMVGYYHRLFDPVTGNCTFWAGYDVATIMENEVGITPYYGEGVRSMIISISEFANIACVGIRKDLPNRSTCDESIEERARFDQPPAFGPAW